MTNVVSNSNPSLGNIEAPASFKDDIGILDRYQAFSSEILRISLLALSGLGALIFKIFFDKDFLTSGFQSPFVRVGIMAASIAFGVAAAAALLHRYCSSDSMSCQLQLLRLEKVRERMVLVNDELTQKIVRERCNRNRMLVISAWSTLVCTVSTAMGGLAFVIVIWGVLHH
jgi:hypothetical protein